MVPGTADLLPTVQRAFENIAAAMRSTEQTFGNAIQALGSKT